MVYNIYVAIISRLFGVPGSVAWWRCSR